MIESSENELEMQEVGLSEELDEEVENDIIATSVKHKNKRTARMIYFSHVLQVGRCSLLIYLKS